MSEMWKFGRTEVIDNTLNPDFVRKFVLDYYFEEKQNLRFDVYNVDSKTCNLPKHDFLGHAYVALGEVIGSQRGRLERPLTHDFIGEFATSYRELSRAQSQFTVYEVTLLSFTVESEFTFVDYIRGGTQLNFTVAIDFTASNGIPSQPTSLHYMSPYQLSSYAMALKAVGEIIQDYDSDKLFPAYGFGAKVPPDGKVSHQFPLNNNPDNPNCEGIEGVLESYFQSLRTVQLYGPTNFAPVINQVARYLSHWPFTLGQCVKTQGCKVIASLFKSCAVKLTLGPLTALWDAGVPMETAMEELDGDEVRVSSRGRYAERDIVQFVPFRDYVDHSGNHVLSMARLAKDVLAEIPEQLLSYMKTRDIKPISASPQ
ncbi:hypothetical protein JD844_013269 [Phrynosoma platyrhinos]|uniref:C2 domain-containing protein n=1 Tax=Phrynosoma platyrhinos TaxID=52577 RepID=A0ABQ7TLI4_PHRPL|nr:hypothetical protein JD844_013269 [Phrynosoma platyrhinos]